VQEISAGGVVFRRQANGDLQIQLIQDRYGRCSLPKGKMEPGETIEQTALREIVEETGIYGVIREPLALIQYEYIHPQHGAVDKEVHYYLVEATHGKLTAQREEIDGVAWYTPEEAWQQQLDMGYSNNTVIVRSALERLGVTLFKQEDDA
jgi:8-oxo-dGTP pyrophosphatase MutT (NUDIX family)